MIMISKKPTIRRSNWMYICLLGLVCAWSCGDSGNRQANDGTATNTTENATQGSAAPGDQAGTPADADVSTTAVSVNPSDFEGTYEGTVPCEDCDGIQTTIVINNDRTYRISSTYLGKNKTLEDNGLYELIQNASAIHLKGKDTDLKLRIGEDRLLELDTDGKVVQGRNAPQYVYTKKQ